MKKNKKFITLVAIVMTCFVVGNQTVRADYDSFVNITDYPKGEYNKFFYCYDYDSNDGAHIKWYGGDDKKIKIPSFIRVKENCEG